MFVRNLRAPGGNARARVILTLTVVGLLAVPSGAAVVPVGVTMDQYELPPADGPGGIDAQPGAPTPAAPADAAPVIVPLPPPLFSGLLGLGAMAAIRVCRRVGRRR
jgi:hypothetical protein